MIDKEIKVHRGVIRMQSPMIQMEMKSTGAERQLFNDTEQVIFILNVNNCSF